MKLIRSQHFKDWIESKYVECYGVLGLGSQVAKDKFKETMYEDFNLLSWILDGTFPHTHWDGSQFVFETEDMEHNMLENQSGKNHLNVGHCKITIKNGECKLAFDLKGFVHPHANKRDGGINCYGGYRRFYDNVKEIGFASGLMDAYNFARVSHYYFNPPHGSVFY